MVIHTCSETISFARQMENDSARFYQDLSGRYDQKRDLFLSFAKENEDHITHIERTYYGVITDALEGCFAFNINPEDYSFGIQLAETVTYSQALRTAIEIEEKMIRFYSDAGEQSGSLMADVPRAFKRIAKKRDTRKSLLKSLL